MKLKVTKKLIQKLEKNNSIIEDFIPNEIKNKIQETEYITDGNKEYFQIIHENETITVRPILGQAKVYWRDGKLITAGRNTFLNQPAAGIVDMPCPTIAFSKKKNFYAPGSFNVATVQQSLKLLNTSGFTIWNLEFEPSIFNTLEEFLEDLNNLKESKKNKNPVTFTVQNEYILISGSTEEGAQKTDLCIKLKAIEKLSQDKKVIFPDTVLKIPLSNGQKNSYEDARSQAEFINNLIIKYGKPKCLFCNLDIFSLLKAAHFKRVADINKEYISFDKKKDQSTSSFNGHYMCANHDILFERGIITISNELKLSINTKNEEILKYIDATIMKTNFFSILSEESKFYLEEHAKRFK